VVWASAGTVHAPRTRTIAARAILRIEKELLKSRIFMVVRNLSPHLAGLSPQANLYVNASSAKGYSPRMQIVTRLESIRASRHRYQPPEISWVLPTLPDST